MIPLTVRCIRSAFVCLAAGITRGMTFAFNRALGETLRPLHAELNVWGWVTVLMYGMGYHMLPRFTGRPLRSPQLAEAQSWLAIAGVALASIGWIAQAGHLSVGYALLVTGGALEAGGARLFAWLVGDLLRLRSA